MFGKLWEQIRHKRVHDDREEKDMWKITESQQALISAATSTADAANDLHDYLSRQLDDTIKQFETTVRILTDALFIVDSGGVIEAHNPAAERIFGYTETELAGQSLTELFVATDTGDLTIEELWGLFERGHAFDGHSLTDRAFEGVRGVRKSTELFHCDVSVSKLSRSDKHSVLLVLVRDVTAHIEISEKLQMLGSQFTKLFETSFDAILVIDDGIILAANPAAARVLDHSENHMLGRPIQTFLHADATAIFNVPEDAVAHGHVRGINARGEEVELEFRCSSIKWRSDQVATLVLLRPGKAAPVRSSSGDTP